MIGLASLARCPSALISLGFVAFCGCATIRSPQLAQVGGTSPDYVLTNLLPAEVGAPLQPGNKITPLVNGDTYFPEMLRAIAEAEHTILLENFALSSGKVADEFIAALAERARAGVQVYCLIDWVGAWRLKKEDRARLRASGAHLILYNRPRWRDFWNCNHRTHRKILAVDSRVAFIGGICLTDRWAGDAHDAEHWRDSNYKIEGPVVEQAEAIALLNLKEHGVAVRMPNSGAPRAHGASLAHVVSVGPHEGDHNAEITFAKAIGAARQTIFFEQSYFLPGRRVRHALLEARARGVQIQVVTSGPVGMNMVRRAARASWGDLLRAGVQIFEYQPTKYHCKAMIVDGKWATVGSINVDHRSFHINDEANLNVFDPHFAELETAIFERDKSRTLEMTLEKYRNRPVLEKIWEQFCGLFRPLY